MLSLLKMSRDFLFIRDVRCLCGFNVNVFQRKREPAGDCRKVAVACNKSLRDICRVKKGVIKRREMKKKTAYIRFVEALNNINKYTNKLHHQILH